VKRYLNVFVVTVGLLGPIGHARCQGLTPAQLNLKAKIENVTEIPDEASPDFLKTYKIELRGTFSASSAQCNEIDFRNLNELVVGETGECRSSHCVQTESGESGGPGT
jgi:hypothetical protein